MRFFKKFVFKIWRIWLFIYRHFFDRSVERTHVLKLPTRRAATVMDYLGETNRTRIEDGFSRQRRRRQNIDIMDYILRRMPRRKKVK